jgi:hypothetical protein
LIKTDVDADLRRHDAESAGLIKTDVYVDLRRHDAEGDRHGVIPVRLKLR